MTIRIAINGYGRIGRNILRARYENPEKYQDIDIVAINDLGSPENNTHLTRFDSTHGPFRAGDVSLEGNDLCVNGDRIAFSQEIDPSRLPWRKHKIDLVLACSGHFTSREKAQHHIDAGAKKVLISAPAKDVDATIVYGVNHSILTNQHTIVSNASCTTNCLAPLVKPLNDHLGIKSGLMTTVHAYTRDQNLSDGHHSDLRRARSATQSIIPTKTGAAMAVGEVLPELRGKLDGFALRVPTLNVSIVDLTFLAERDTSIKEVNAILEEASLKELAGILIINREPLVSCDFNHNPASSIFDATQTKVIDRLVNVLAWYDNEWGFSNRMLDTSLAWMRQSA